jgi:hypothetical protein
MFEFEGLPPPACEPCLITREEQFLIVRSLVKEYPGITALEVNEITDVPVNEILRYIDKGMIEVIPRHGVSGERIGIMMQAARERAKIILKERSEIDSKIVDSLGFDNETEKFRWLGE